MRRYRPRIASDGEIEFRVADDGAWVLYADVTLDVDRMAQALHASPFHSRYHSGGIDEADQLMAAALVTEYNRRAE